MKKRIAIIGAGIAGISSAIYLAERGFDVSLFESSNNIGGRMSSFLDSKSGELLDVGQHIMIGAYEHFFNLLKKLGTYDFLYQQKRFKVKFLFKNNSETVLEQKFFNDNKGILIGLLLMKGICLKSKIRLVNLIAKIINQKISDTGLNCEEFLRTQNQGIDSIKLFWEPFIIGTMNSELNEAPANALIKVINEIFFDSGEKAKIFIPKTELIKLISPIERYLKDRLSQLMLNHRLKSIDVFNDKVISLKINDLLYDDFDAVILALPPEAIKQIGKLSSLPNLAEVADSFESSSIITIYLWLDKEIITEKFVALIDSPLQWLFNLTRISDEFNEKLVQNKYSIVISSANKYRDLTKEQILQMCIDELIRFFPQFSSKNIINWQVFNYKRATVRLTPQNVNLRPTAVTAYRNLFLAGDWTATGLPATIEGAVRSGETAARCVINYLSIS